MSCFPFFVDLEQKEGLIVGGGVTALRKIQKLLPYGPRLTVAAPDICREIEALPGLHLLRRPFEPGLLAGKLFVIAATDQPEVNRSVAELCRQRGTLVNVVDSRPDCTFLFPALVKRGELTVGVSTGGASPSAAIWLKERIAALVPERMEEILTYLEAQRAPVRALLPEEIRRGAALKALWLACLERGEPLREEETAALLERLREEGPA